MSLQETSGGTAVVTTIAPIFEKIPPSHPAPADREARLLLEQARCTASRLPLALAFLPDGAVLRPPSFPLHQFPRTGPVAQRLLAEAPIHPYVRALARQASRLSDDAWSLLAARPGGIGTDVPFPALEDFERVVAQERALLAVRLRVAETAFSRGLASLRCMQRYVRRADLRPTLPLARAFSQLTFLWSAREAACFAYAVLYAADVVLARLTDRLAAERTWQDVAPFLALFRAPAPRPEALREV